MADSRIPLTGPDGRLKDKMLPARLDQFQLDERYAPLPQAPTEGETYGIQFVNGQFQWVAMSTTPTDPSAGTVDFAIVGTSTIAA